MKKIEIRITKDIIDSKEEETFDSLIERIESEHGPIEKESLILKGLTLTVILI